MENYNLGEEEFKKDINRLEKIIYEKETIIESKDDYINDLTRTIEEFKVNEKSNKELIESLYKKIDHLEIEKDELEIEMDDLQGDLENLENELSASKEEQQDEIIEELLCDVFPHIKEAHDINETILRKFPEVIKNKTLLSEMENNLANLNYILKKNGVSRYNRRI